MFGGATDGSWWDKARDECHGVVMKLPEPSSNVQPALPTLSGAEKRVKAYKPGERLEQQARKFKTDGQLRSEPPARAKAPNARKRRDYDAWIARMLEESEE
jgi:hypothetical protein